MKKLLFTTSFLTYLLAFTVFADVLSEKEIRQLEDFDRVSVATGIKLHLIPGNYNEAEIETKNTDTEYIITKVSDGKLTIKHQKKNWWNFSGFKGTVHVYLTYKEIKSISASAGANVDSKETLVNNTLKLKASSGASIELDIEADYVTSGASSGANIFLEGECNEYKTSVSSGARIDSDNLESNHVTASASSGANVSVYANKSLTASASSGGSIKYEGSPSDVDRSKSSGGRIKKI